MEILEKVDKDGILKIEVGSNEETLFSLLKVYLEKTPEVDIVGVFKNHHLVDKTQLHIKVKKGSGLDVLKKTIKAAIKDLESKKIK